MYLQNANKEKFYGEEERFEECLKKGLDRLLDICPSVAVLNEGYYLDRFLIVKRR